MFVVVCLSILASVAFFQAVYTTVYVWKLRQHRSVTDVFEPDVNIVLCVRGFDEELVDCLRAIDALDYPSYELTIVFDSNLDPAVEPVTELLAELAVPSQQLFINSVQHMGSLKCQALCTAIRESEATTDVFAFIDADTVVDRNWLTDLVQPLGDEKIGATTGNRFFLPDSGSRGGDLRSAWNSAAIVQMYLYNIAWGGSLAIRKDVVRKVGLLDVWSDKFCEDTVLEKILSQHGLRLHRVPNLIVLNEGNASLGSVVDWITRQLVTSRLYVSLWPLVLVHATGVGLCFAICIASIFNLIFEWSTANLVLVLASFCFQMINLWLVIWIDLANSRILGIRAGDDSGSRGDKGSRELGLPQIGRRLIAVVLSQVVQPYAAWRAQLMNGVSWRGVHYSFRSNGAVDVNNYAPYAAKPTSSKSIGGTEAEST